MNFEALKADIISRAKAASACIDEFERALKATSQSELLFVIIDNIIWCYQQKMLDTTYLIEHFSDLFEEFGIYTSGNIDVKNKNVVLLGSSSATIETLGSSSADYTLIGECSTIKDLTNKKLLVKKSKFEIIEVK